MGNQDKIYEQFKDAADRAEKKGFDRMEAVWNRGEEKLDNKKQRSIAAWWKYTGIAAIFLLFLTVGFFMLNENTTIVAPETTPENNITVIDTQKVNEVLVPSKEIIESAVVVNEATKQDIDRQGGVSAQVIVSDTAHIITKEVATVTIQPKTLQKAKESVMANADTVLSEVAIIDTTTNSIRNSAVVTSFSSSPLEDSSNADMIQSLQGQVAGLTIGSGSGEPGSTDKVVFNRTDPLKTDPQTQFKNDLERNTISIYTLGGLYRGDYETDVAFQKEYGLTYHSFGCTAPPNLNYYEAYNLLVFKYLEDMYGSVWEEKIRQDAMALTKWKERE